MPSSVWTTSGAHTRSVLEGCGWKIDGKGHDSVSRGRAPRVGLTAGDARGTQQAGMDAAEI
jgi:hypothetical protein